MLIALDSNVFIAALSQNEEHSEIAQKLIRDINSGKHTALASSIVYGEVLSTSTSTSTSTSIIYRHKSELDLEGFFAHIDNLSTIPADDDINLKAGQLRIQYGSQLKLPDALHIATALLANADMFITNDVALAKIAKKLLPAKGLSHWR